MHIVFILMDIFSMPDALFYYWVYFGHHESRSSSLGIVTRLLSRRPKNRGSITVKVRDFPLF